MPIDDPRFSLKEIRMKFAVTRNLAHKYLKEKQVLDFLGGIPV